MSGLGHFVRKIGGPIILIGSISLVSKGGRGINGKAKGKRSIYMWTIICISLPARA
jgi:hypothetical protein